MKVKQIGDWTLEDRLAAGGPPVVAMFLKAEGRSDRLRRENFRQVAEKHPESNFYEVDLIENTSLGPMILRVLGPCHTEGDES